MGNIEEGNCILCARTNARIEFWVQVMRMNDDRLVKVVMLEALEIGSKVRWVKDLQQSLEKLGWRGLNVVTLDGLTIKEVKQLLKDTAWH